MPVCYIILYINSLYVTVIFTKTNNTLQNLFLHENTSIGIEMCSFAMYVWIDIWPLEDVKFTVWPLGPKLCVIRIMKFIFCTFNEFDLWPCRRWRRALKPRSCCRTSVRPKSVWSENWSVCAVNLTPATRCADACERPRWDGSLHTRVYDIWWKLCLDKAAGGLWDW